MPGATQLEQPSGHKKWYSGHMEQGCKTVVVMVVVMLVVVLVLDVVVEVTVVVVVVVVVTVVSRGILLPTNDTPDTYFVCVVLIARA